APAGPGTQVVVEELFGALPARRKFLRRPETELRHVEEVLLRLALARPEVALQLDHDGRTVRQLPPSGGDLEERIRLVLRPEGSPLLLPLPQPRLGLPLPRPLHSPPLTPSP